MCIMTFLTGNLLITFQLILSVASCTIQAVVLHGSADLLSEAMATNLLQSSENESSILLMQSFALFLPGVCHVSDREKLAEKKKKELLKGKVTLRKSAAS